MKKERKSRVEWGYFSKMLRQYESKEITHTEGVKNYKLSSVYAPVLDRKYLDNFDPKKTCISLCGNEPYELKDTDKFIKQVIEIIEQVKQYYINKTEHIFEYSLFDHFKDLTYDCPLCEDLMLHSYTIRRQNSERNYVNGDNKYYVILWFTPKYYSSYTRKHLYWYGEKSDCDWF